MPAKSSWWFLNDDQWRVKLDSSEVTLQHLPGILREATSYLSQMLRVRESSLQEQSYSPLDKALLLGRSPFGQAASLILLWIQSWFLEYVHARVLECQRKLSKIAEPAVFYMRQVRKMKCGWFILYAGACRWESKTVFSRQSQFRWVILQWKLWERIIWPR